jgi:hypothetical protein
LVYVDLFGYASEEAKSYKWRSEEDIPNDASYFPVKRGERTVYYSADKSAYDDPTTYNIAAGMAKSQGAERQTMDRGFLGGLKHTLSHALGGYEEWRTGDASMVVESDEATSEASGTTLDPLSIPEQQRAQRQRQLNRMLGQGEDVLRENAPDPEKVAEAAKEGSAIAVVGAVIDETARVTKNPLAKLYEKIKKKFKGKEDSVAPKGKGKIPWGSWSDYKKVEVDGQEYAQVGDRLYSEHAVNRMQPGRRRHSSKGETGGLPEIYQAGTHGDHGRGVAPQFVEDAISSAKPVLQENGNLSYTSGSLQVITNQQGAVVTIITH